LQDVVIHVAKEYRQRRHLPMSDQWVNQLYFGDNLDQAVLAAYGWPPDIDDDCLLERLLELNLQRAVDESQGRVVQP